MARDEKRAKPRTVKKTSEAGVVVGSEVGVTLPIDDTTAHLRFSFWHERIAPNGSQESIRKTAALVDEFNEAELERRVEKYTRLIRRIVSGEGEETESEQHSKANPKKKGKSVRDRARARAGYE